MSSSGSRLLAFRIASTVTPYIPAMESKESPLSTV
jgi:hypothetical protein